MGTQDVVTAPDPVLPGSRPAVGARAWREVLLGLAVFGLYALVVLLPEGARRRTARAHAETLFGWERSLHLDVERTLNGWLADQSVLRVLANYEYAVTYIASAIGLLAWLYVKHPDKYRTARNSFVLLNLLGLACFTLYPLMPPRLTPDLGFIDTVRLGRTWGSWGSPLVENADQLAAMPSLHMAWTLWVGVELARISALRSIQLLNAVHVLVTLYVILATANHYVLDAVAAVPLVAVAVYAGRRTERVAARPERVAATDAFFLAVETPRAPQHVGGVMVLDTSAAEVRRSDIVGLIVERLDRVPRFRQRLAAPSRLRRPVWTDHPAIDWDWHVVEREADGVDGLRAIVAALEGEVLPRDRPLWRMVLVRGVAPGRTAVVFLMHHVVADGIGVVAQALLLMDAPPAAPPAGAPRRPGLLRRAAATAVGFAQLAADAPPRTRLPVAGTAGRRFGTATLPLALLRDVARRHGTRVTDVVLSAVAGAVHRVGPDTAPDTVARFAVPLMMRSPDSGAEGNHTTAVMVDLPIGALPEHERLARVARRCRAQRTGTRAQAAWFVMRDVARLMPAPLHRRFARAVYGPRFLQGVVSNMPGPVTRPRFAGAPLDEVYPVIPLVPGAPLAVGALSIAGELCVSVSADPALADDADALLTAFRAVIAELDGGPVA
ncbi:bifunctional phosphatase PAP2/O-acyltransferase family protein [Actinomadura rubteroloni]|uniref:bifunctional phosphatase PAP2/O-acyltransferase family protein n=1 Tax=Actinomadura rubteroloni TaxID=1926885 RepID=UPI0011B01764|nr:phosphatase PAP2 family protein [Actinomadura rubteroloni]